MIEGKKVFITGGAGFIGSTLVGRLIDRNEVVVYDNLYRNTLKDQSYRDHPNLRLLHGDVLDLDSLCRAMEGADIIVHCAAIVGVLPVLKNPVNAMRVNMLGSANILDAASRLSRCERVVCFSTSEVFGTNAFRPSEQGSVVLGHVGETRWTYAVSKLATEHLALAYWRETGLPTTVVRPFNVYGPGQKGHGVVRAFVRSALRGEDIEVHGDGTQIRAWCYVDDMVQGTMLAMSHPNAVGESFNIGNPSTATTVYGLAQTVVRVLNSPSRIRFTNKDYPDVDLRVPSIEKATQLLGYRPQVGLEDGIQRTAEYYRTHMEAPVAVAGDGRADLTAVVRP